MTVSAKAVANYFLGLGEEADASICPMKLQKLLYYSQGWCLAITGELLFNEQIEAWRWGPVVRSVYHEFKDFGNSRITRRARRLRVHQEKGQPQFAWSEPNIEDGKTDPEELKLIKALLGKIWDVYGQYSSIQLSNMTHAQGSPWSVVVKEYGGSPPKGTDIPPSLIKSHFNAAAKAE